MEWRLKRPLKANTGGGTSVRMQDSAVSRAPQGTEPGQTPAPPLAEYHTKETMTEKTVTFGQIPHCKFQLK